QPAAVKEMTQRFTTALERIVRAAPEQYFWLHRRWKHQPKAKKGRQAAEHRSGGPEGHVKRMSTQADSMNVRLTTAHLNEPVTQHMRRDWTAIRMDQTVGAALVGLQRQPPEGRIIYFYVVDGEGRLQGVLPTRRLLLSAPERP